MLAGRVESSFEERSRTVSPGDHLRTSGSSMSLFLLRLSSLRLGNSKRQRGTVTSSLCCRSSFTT